MAISEPSSPPAAVPAPVPAPAPARPLLGAFDLGCIVIGGIVGVGIFFTPQAVAAAVSSPEQVILAWSLGGLLALLGAFVFAGLATRLPGHGGTFSYLRHGLGDGVGFVYGFANWLVIQAGALAVIGLVMVEHLDQVLHGGPATSVGTRVLIAIAAIAAFTLLNWFGLRVGKRVQNLLVVGKLLAVFGLVLLAGLVDGDAGATAAAELPPGAGLLAAMLPVLFAYGGWQQGAFVAGAARQPRRDVPLGILGGVVVVVLAYVTLNLAFLDLLGFDGARRTTTIAVDALRAALGPEHELAPRLLGGIVVLSALGILNTICLAPPYVLLTMADRGLLPPAFGQLHARWRSPSLAVLLQGGAGIALLLSVHLATGNDPKQMLGSLVDGVVFVDWVFFALCGFVLLRMREPVPLPLRAVALLFTLGAVAIAAGAIAGSPQPSLIGAALTLLGIPAYFLLRRGSGTAAA